MWKTYLRQSWPNPLVSSQSLSYISPKQVLTQLSQNMLYYFLTALFFTPLFDLAENSIGFIYTPVFLPEEFHRQRCLAGHLLSMGLQRVGHMTESLTLSHSTYRFNLHNHQLDILL